MNLSDITIVLPTKNEASNLPRFLASLPPQVRLIIVDASSDETPELAVSIRPNNTRIIPSSAHIAEARNIGASVSMTHWLLFTDADVEFPGDYFSRLHALHPQSALYGSKRAPDAYDRYYQGFSRWQGFFHWIGIPAVSGSNFLVKRSIFIALEGFDQRLRVNEDTELGYRIKRAGYAVDFEPSLRVLAFDQRRLKKGMLRKDLFTLLRCTLIYLNAFPQLWREKDWGYWS